MASLLDTLLNLLNLSSPKGNGSNDPTTGGAIPTPPTGSSSQFQAATMDDWIKTSLTDKAPTPIDQQPSGSDLTSHRLFGDITVEGGPASKFAGSTPTRLDIGSVNPTPMSTGINPSIGPIITPNGGALNQNLDTSLIGGGNVVPRNPNTPIIGNTTTNVIITECVYSFGEAKWINCMFQVNILKKCRQRNTNGTFVGEWSAPSIVGSIPLERWVEQKQTTIDGKCYKIREFNSVAFDTAYLSGQAVWFTDNTNNSQQNISELVTGITPNATKNPAFEATSIAPIEYPAACRVECDADCVTSTSTISSQTINGGFFVTSNGYVDSGSAWRLDPSNPCQEVQDLVVYPQQGYTVLQHLFPITKTCSDGTSMQVGTTSVEERIPESPAPYTVQSSPRKLRRDGCMTYSYDYIQKPSKRNIDDCYEILTRDVFKVWEDGTRELVIADQPYDKIFRADDPFCFSKSPTLIYHPFDPRFDITTNRYYNETDGLFNGTGSLYCYVTSSNQTTTQKEYYYDVLSTACDTCDVEPWFSVAWGHKDGSGSLRVGYESGDTPSKAIWSQYRLLCLPSETTAFTFRSGSTYTESKQIYVINFNRKSYIDKLDPGNIEINLAELNGTSYANNVYTGSHVLVQTGSVVLRLIDSSMDAEEGSCQRTDDSYEIFSGSMANGIYDSNYSYGYLYPSLGVIVLDATRINSVLNFNSVTGSNINGDNAYKLYTSISGAYATTLGRSTLYPILGRNVKYKTTSYYYVKIGPIDSNYSNNPTWTSGSTGYPIYNCWKENPTTYISSIGLYNNKYELVAVAKLNKPMQKNFFNQAMLKIRLNY